jgi:hypothetical protein
MAIRRNPRLSRWLVLGFALPVAAWFGYVLVAFGRILPMSGSVAPKPLRIPPTKRLLEYPWYRR